MKKLEKELRKNGFDYKQVKETEKGFIYSQSMPIEEGGRLIAYEVFERKENTQYGCVSFPTNEAFGKWAWTYKSLEDAEQRLLTF